MYEHRSGLALKTTRERRRIVGDIALFDKATRLGEQQMRTGRSIWEWDAMDSPLLPVDSATGKPALSFHESFADVLPTKEALKEYIERVLAPRKGQAIGIELGGTGSALFGGFTPGFFNRSAGINLTDYRSKLDPDPTSDDLSINHIVIPESVFSNAAKNELLPDFLDGEKADLIISRMEGGLSLFPDEPFFLGKEADFWYRQLAEGGLIVAMYPPALEPFMPFWIELINSRFQGKLDVQYHQSTTPKHYSVMRLHKLAGAPEHLPLVGALLGKREVKGTE